MSTLPSNTILGNLQIIEVYDYYDGPCLFACQNGSGQIFISVWVDQTKTTKTWLYAPISASRFKEVRAGKVDLHSVFAKAEDGFVLQVIVPHGSEFSSIVEFINCENLEEDHLPEEGQVAELEAEALQFAPNQSPAEIAQRKGQEVVHLSLEFPSKTTHQAPSAYLGTILSSFQYTIHAIGQILEKGGARKFISSETAEKTEFDVFATSPGSFVIELISSSTEKDLFGNTLAGDALEELTKLLSTGSNRDELSAHLVKLQNNSASKYRDFLDAIVEAGIDIRINWGSPNPERGGVTQMPFSTARDTLDILKETEVENITRYSIVGELVAVHKRNKRFEIRDVQGQMKYKGTILDVAMRDASTATISRLYSAVIEEELIIEPVTGKQKKEYRLAELTPWTGQESVEAPESPQESSSSQLDLLS